MFLYCFFNIVFLAECVSNTYFITILLFLCIKCVNLLILKKIDLKIDHYNIVSYSKMADTIVDGTNIDVNVFSYSNPKPHSSGGKVVNLYNKNFRESLTISTPLMLTWGAQEGQDSNKNPNGKYAMSLQFPSSEYNTPEAEMFLKNLKALEHKVKLDAMANSKEWFGKEIKSFEVIEEKFNPMLKYPKKEKGGAEFDYNKPPTISVKIPQWSGVWKPEIYDEDGEPLYINGKVNNHLSPLEYLKPKTHLISLIQCGGLWFVNGKISITWNLKQAMVQTPKPTIEGKCFLKPKESDKEKMKTLPPPEEHIDPEGVHTTLVEDSDDEREYPDIKPVVEVPVPVVEVPVQVVETPVPVVEATVEDVKPKKKIVKKKTDA